MFVNTCTSDFIDRLVFEKCAHFSFSKECAASDSILASVKGRLQCSASYPVTMQLVLSHLLCFYASINIKIKSLCNVIKHIPA